jgi:hypothetical protein
MNLARRFNAGLGKPTVPPVASATPDEGCKFNRRYRDADNRPHSPGVETPG